MEKIVDLQTTTQHILVQGDKNEWDLYLDDQHITNSKDFYRYYEALVHPVVSAHQKCQKVLVLGGANGCAASELLKYPEIEDIHVVDNDKTLCDLFKTDEILCKVNNSALTDGRVTFFEQDIVQYLEKSDEKYDVIIADYQKPYDTHWSECYSREFYELMRGRLADSNSLFVTSAGSPTETPKFFWSVLQTILDAGMYVSPYHQFVQSKGDVGFNIGGKLPFRIPDSFVIPTKSLNKNVIHAMMVFGPDQMNHEVEIITKENQLGYDYYNNIENIERLCTDKS